MLSDVTRAPINGGSPAPQSITATVASTSALAITGNSTAGAVYEFVAAGDAHVAFGLSTLSDDTLRVDLLCSRKFKLYVVGVGDN